MGLPYPHRLNVLLIDDCVAERDLYQCVLEPEFHILTATRGIEGAALAAAYQPDAIVLDVLMPGIDGWETCARIKGATATAGIPVLFLTGAEGRDLSYRAKAVWAWTVLHKPCPADTLRIAILAATGRLPQFH
jgi:two-component system cell cycle response regulator